MADTNKNPTSAAPIEKSLLPSATAKLYRLVNWHGGHTQVFGSIGTINVSTLTTDQAARLVRLKFSKIEKK